MPDEAKLKGEVETMERKLYQELASLVDARLRCMAKDNPEWKVKHEQAILALVKENMPSGSGIDCGTKIDLDRSTGEKLVFTFSYHHMHESGMYDGWTEHTLTVKASLMFGVELHISGRDRNGFKEYLYEIYQDDLTKEIVREAVA